MVVGGGDHSVGGDMEEVVLVWDRARVDVMEQWGERDSFRFCRVWEGLSTPKLLWPYQGPYEDFLTTI